LLTALSMLTTSEFYVTWLWVNVTQIAVVTEALLATNHDNVQTFFWHKVDNRPNVPAHRFVSSVECAVVGYSKKSACYSSYISLPPSLLARTNCVIGPGQHKMDRNAKGEVINIHQKPAYLSEFIGSMFSTPDAKVVVLGSGAGGDVKGFMNLDREIVAIEKDKAQLDAMLGNLREYEPKLEANKIISNLEIRTAKNYHISALEEVDQNVCALCPPKKEVEGLLQICHSCGGAYCPEHWGKENLDEAICITCGGAAQAAVEDAGPMLALPAPAG